MVIKEAEFYKKLDDGRVKCLLCPNNCTIPEGEKGECRLRENRGGKLIALSYGNTVTTNLDPVEKKPLYHFMPAGLILSVGPNGCTLKCRNCQNWSISQEDAPVRYIGPEELVNLSSRGASVGVAFTYTEPLLYFEYMKDVIPMLREEGKKSVVVTNGYFNRKPVREIVELADGFNVDLKSMDDQFYRKWCDGSVEPVKDFIRMAAESSHLEVTNLLIPGLNDSREELEAMARWLSEISPDIPLHISRFFPQYKMNDLPPTPRKTLRDAYKIANNYLNYVYIGNVSTPGTSDTFCPECGEKVIERSGYSTRVLGEKGVCPSCGNKISGVWS